jgi:hypothetical protein
VPYLRLTADRRGVEHTFLLHVPTPGAPPKVLYWYRTAPGLRIGRPALDDAAMRAIEEQYPDIDFDWPYILDMGAMTPVEVEAPLPPRKRKARPAEADVEDEPTPEVEPRHAAPVTAATPDVLEAPAAERARDLLAELLGRGIASSLRTRYADLRALVDASPAEPAVKDSWRARMAALDPDGWSTPEAVLAGMSSAEPLLEALRRDVQTASAD